MRHSHHNEDVCDETQDEKIKNLVKNAEEENISTPPPNMHILHTYPGAFPPDPPVMSILFTPCVNV